MNDLDKFGKLIAEDLRDNALNRYLDIKSGFVGSEEAKDLTFEVSKLDEAQKTQVALRAEIAEQKKKIEELKKTIQELRKKLFSQKTKKPTPAPIPETMDEEPEPPALEPPSIDPS